MDPAFGFYGKLPSHGDFVRRGLPDEFVVPWDRWLQHGLAELRSQVGAAAGAMCSASPTWRFVLGPGLVGAEVWAGVWLPSSDRVGRQFPFCIAAGLPGTVSVFRCAALSHDWFDRLEQVVPRALAEQCNDLDTMHQTIQANFVRLPPARRLASSGPDLRRWRGSQATWQFELPAGGAIDLGMIDALEELALADLGQLSLWWTDGGGGREPQWRCRRGWPDVDDFIDMLGSPDESEADTPPFDETLIHEVSSPEAPGQWVPDELAASPMVRIGSDDASLTAAAWTDTGKVRTANEDAYLLATDTGLWAVADGMGGHSHGELASRMVVETLSGFSGKQDLRSAVATVLKGLHEVNGRLRAFAADPADGFDSGTTVVALLVEGDEAAVVWVGDSRLYRLRSGMFDLLTVDHSAEVEAKDEGSASVLDLLSSSSGELTRAVGGTDVLEPEVQYFRVEPGDRLLLCTDGLYSEVAPAGLAAALGQGSAEAAVQMLAKHMQASEARDNATAVVVMVVKSAV
jgi:type VI secretion system protein ImpM